VLAAFTLTDHAGADQKIYMMRDPQNHRMSYTGIWSTFLNQTDWQFRQYVSDMKIPFTDVLFMNSETGVSQDFSVFFLDYTEFTAAFETFTIAHDRESEGYANYWYDQDNNSGANEDYKIVPTAQVGDLYFSVYSYPLNSIPLT
jgi:hypothetical protein